MAKTNIKSADIIPVGGASLNSTTVTTLADTYVDVAGASMTLTEGQWEIIFEGTVGLSCLGSQKTMYGTMKITDSTGALLDNAIALFASNLPANQSTVFHNRLSGKVTVNAGSSLAVKLQIRSDVSAAAGSFGVFPQNFTGGLTDPDGSARFYARKIT